MKQETAEHLKLDAYFAKLDAELTKPPSNDTVRAIGGLVASMKALLAPHFRHEEEKLCYKFMSEHFSEAEVEAIEKDIQNGVKVRVEACSLSPG